MSGRLTPVLAITLAGLVLAPAWADRDQDDIKRLRDAGEIMPLHAIIEKFRERRPQGRLLEAELEIEDGRYVYELKILDDSGTVQDLQYDARTAEFLKIQEEH